jgi:multicomponent Na+:H+ antiporter subunit D
MNAPVLPLVFPLLTALLALFWWRPAPARRTAVALAAAGQTLFAGWLLARTLADGVLVLGVGEWSLRAGVIIAVDPLSALMVLLASGTVLLAILYGFAESPAKSEHPLRLPLLQFLLMGINLSFITGDLFNLFVGFEVMLISSYALLTLEADDWEVKQAYPYLALNLIGSTLFICAAGLLYALAGTLNYALLHERLAGLSTDPRLTVLAFMLLSVFTLKAGLFPLHFWLPNSYPILATPLAAVYAGLLTKVGLYVLLRVLGTVLPHDLTTLHQALGAMALLTLLAGGLGSLARGFIRGLLSFQVVSAVGVMALALAWFTPLGVTACLFYLMQDVVVKAGLFFAGGVATRLSNSDQFSRMGGLWKAAPVFGVIFLALALSLTGLPPFSGFWAKLAVLQSGLAAEAYTGVIAILLTSAMTLIALLRVWHHAFWRPAPADSEPAMNRIGWRRMTLVTAFTALLALGMGLWAEPVYQLARRAAETLLDADGYAIAVQAFVGKGETPP